MVNVNRVNISINLLIYDWILKILRCTCLKDIKIKGYKKDESEIFRVHTKSKQADTWILDYISSKTKSNIWDKGEHFMNPTEDTKIPLCFMHLLM